MPSFSFQQYILYFTILILVYFRMIFNIICRYLSLHHSRLFCVTTYIIQVFPLHQILPDQFPVKENNRDVILFCQPDDPGRSSSVYQIDAQNITTGINHPFHYIILILLIIISIFYRYGNLHIFCFHRFQIFF